MSKLDVGIIFGGKSSEHEISLSSVKSIINNISKEKYELHLIGITKEGHWKLFEGNVENISSEEWEKNKNLKDIIFANSENLKGLFFLDNGNLEKVKIDVILPVLHGKNGEDGTIQGMMEILQIPYVGCKVFASAACMDKIATNTMLEYYGINKPKFYWFNKYDFEQDSEECLNNIERKIKNYPMFVKPSNAGSSVGISKVHDRNELAEGIKKAIKEDNRILVEEYIKGKEVECAVLGNNSPVASIVGQIVPSNDFYDYDAKYIDDNSKLFIPAKIDDAISDEVRKTAKKAFKVMDCKGLSRIDFFVEDNTNKVYLNEINTFPGFTSISMYPKLMEKMGIDMENLIDKLISLAIEK